MTPYILAIGALAWALAWARRRDRKRPQQPQTIGTVVNVEEDDKGVKFKILLAGDQTEKTDKEQKSKTKDFAKSSTTHKNHGSTLRHTTEKQKTPKEDDTT